MNATQLEKVTELLAHLSPKAIEEEEDGSFVTIVFDDNSTVEIWKSGFSSWWKDSMSHREDGPAIEYSNGEVEFWENGKLIKQKKK